MSGYQWTNPEGYGRIAWISLEWSICSFKGQKHEHISWAILHEIALTRWGESCGPQTSANVWRRFKLRLTQNAWGVTWNQQRTVEVTLARYVTWNSQTLNFSMFHRFEFQVTTYVARGKIDYFTFLFGSLRPCTALTTGSVEAVQGDCQRVYTKNSNFERWRVVTWNLHEPHLPLCTITMLYISFACTSARGLLGFCGGSGCVLVFRTEHNMIPRFRCTRHAITVHWMAASWWYPNKRTGCCNTTWNSTNKRTLRGTPRTDKTHFRERNARSRILMSMASSSGMHSLLSSNSTESIVSGHNPEAERVQVPLY